MNSNHHNQRPNRLNHRRRSIRLKGYDYSQNGAYFVTICTRNHELIFENERIRKIVEEKWLNTEKIRHNVIIDEFVVMPNHLHGIVIIEGGVGAYGNTPLHGEFKSPSQTLGAIMRGFKAASALKINIIRNTPRKPVWQRNYYDHIIRNDLYLSEKRKYIKDNPLKWDIDEDNPMCIRLARK